MRNKIANLMLLATIVLILATLIMQIVLANINRQIGQLELEKGQLLKDIYELNSINEREEVEYKSI